MITLLYQVGFAVLNVGMLYVSVVCYQIDEHTVLFVMIFSHNKLEKSTNKKFLSTRALHLSV